MDIYWILEYGKVLGGYIFLMFIWPTAVLRKYLKGKSKIYYFSFCVTVQPVIVNTVVLMLGLLNILNRKVVICLFYVIFLVSLCQMKIVKQVSFVFNINRKEYAQQIMKLKIEIVEEIQNFWRNVRSRIGEYIILSLLIIFGMVYFSYGVFQVHSYVHYDTFTHHGWINSLVEGNVFSEGVYPEAMHCFVYCLHVLFGIRIYSIVLFLQCIHIAVFLLSGYFLLREVFQWRYTPLFVLGLYLTLDFAFEYSMSRLQATFPMEFGLHTQFICALFLIRYLKNNVHIVIKGKKSKWYWDENLLLFMISLSASIAIHYYTTIMAFILCASIAVFHIRKIISPKRFFPLTLAVICGCIIAVIPMVGALASGIPFEGSIEWGINSIEGKNQWDGQNKSLTRSKVSRGLLDPTPEDLEVIEKLPNIGKKITEGIIKVEYFIKEIYRKGYQGMYLGKRGRLVFEITLIVIGLCLIGRKWGDMYIRKIICGYSPIILVSFLVVLIYAAYNSPDMMFPVLIADHRFCSSGHMLILAVILMPTDAIFSIATHFIKDSIIQSISLIVTACIYIFTNVSGNYHSHLYSVLLRYDSAAIVTNLIIEEFPQNSYTIISPTEEMYQIAPYGEHEEIFRFLKNCESGEYSLQTKYVFLYVEKKPIVYFQNFYFNGPSWLGKNRTAKIETTDISEEAARKRIPDPGMWSQYGKEGRTILESKAYEWCKQFSELYPRELNIYYEDDNFVCYYFKQDPDVPYDLGI